MPGHPIMFAPNRLERDADGRLLVIGEAVGGIGNSAAALAWTDSAWTPFWELGTATAFIWPVDAPGFRKVFVWRTVEPVGPSQDQSYLVVSELVGSSLAFQDSVVLLTGGLQSYAAAASRRRIWAAALDVLPPNVPNTRFFLSEAAGDWQELSFGVRQGGDGISLLAEDDTTLVVALGSFSETPRLRLGRLRGDRWEDFQSAPSHSFFVLAPQLRRRAGGGYWLAWATQDSFIAWSTYRDGTWAPTRKLTFEHSHPSIHSTNWVFIGEDPNEYPAIAMSAYSNRTGLQRVFVSIPADTGFTIGEEIPNSDEGIPVVLRDENGDVWLVWYRFFGGMYWQHTHVTATATDLAIGGHAGARALIWNLTEPAPKSRWAVLRAANDGPFELATHVVADKALTVSWTDSSPPAGVLRYKLRRECLDVRHQWESPEVRWPLRSRRPIHFTRVAAPLVPGQMVELSGAAAGEVHIKLFDVLGRRVYERRWQATGSGIDRIPIDAGRPVGSGVYFLRAVDSSGSASAPARIVLLR